MKKLAAAAVAVGLAVFGSPGSASASITASLEFTIVKVGTNPGTVIARGVFTAAGIENNNRHLVPPGTPFQVTFSFPQGDLYQTASPAGPPQIVESNPITCVTRMILRTTTVVTGGTGALAGATGSGMGTANRTIVSGRASDGSCLPVNQPSVFELSYVQASTTVTLP